MCRLNPFIQTNLTRFEAFFEEIVTSSGDEDLQERQLTTDEAYPCACYLHAAICRYPIIIVIIIISIITGITSLSIVPS